MQLAGFLVELCSFCGLSCRVMCVVGIEVILRQAGVEVLCVVDVEPLLSSLFFTVSIHPPYVHAPH